MVVGTTPAGLQRGTYSDLLPVFHELQQTGYAFSLLLVFSGAGGKGLFVSVTKGEFELFCPKRGIRHRWLAMRLARASGASGMTFSNTPKGVTIGLGKTPEASIPLLRSLFVQLYGASKAYKLAWLRWG